jgi:hypothetical protein
MDLTLRETGTAATEARRTERETNTAESCMIGERGFRKWIRTRNEDVDRAQLWMKFVKGMRGGRAKACKRWRLLSEAGQALYDAFGDESPGTTSRAPDCAMRQSFVGRTSRIAVPGNKESCSSQPFVSGGSRAQLIRSLCLGSIAVSVWKRCSGVAIRYRTLT